MKTKSPMSAMGISVFTDDKISEKNIAIDIWNESFNETLHK